MRLKSYPKESMVSEKFHAMIRHAQLNSRFKDYYDLWLIAHNFEFDVQSLQRQLKRHLPDETLLFLLNDLLD